MEVVAELITQLGFPIACVVAMGYFIWTIYKQSVDREDKLMDLLNKQNDKFDVQNEQLQAIALTQERIIDRLEKLENKGAKEDE